MSNPKKRAAESAPPPKKAKKRKTKFQEDEALDTELGLNTLFSRMDNQLLADHLAQKISRFGGDLSSVELSDLTVSGEIRQVEIDVRRTALTLRRCSKLDTGHNVVAGEEDPR